MHTGRYQAPESPVIPGDQSHISE